VPLSLVRRAALLSCALACTGGAAAARGFDFDSLRQLIRAGNIGTIEQLLAALPATERSHYTLVFESRSLQGASLKSPRAILFGPDARLILTFNGDPAQRGYRTLETMEFDATSQEFRLRELEFAAGGGAPVVSAVNPERCARCHGTPARPVWDTFPLWPGAYGERYRSHLSARERSGLASFLAAQPTHPRYRQLLYTERYADAQTFRPSAVSLYSGSVQEPPNAELTLALTRLQSQAITRQLEQQPAFAAYRYALLGMADEACGALAEFYPEALWRAQREGFARFATDTVAANARQAQLKALRAGAAARAQVSNAALLQLRFVAESALGVQTRDWTLALEKGTYDFSLPPLAPQPLREALLRELESDDPSLRELSDTSTSADGDRYCSYLRRRSRAALTPAATGAPLLTDASRAAAAPAASADPAAAAAPPSLQLCIACHESGVAPPLPFSDAAQLARQLHTRGTPHGALLDEIRFRLSAAAGAQRMPLGLNLSDADRASLERYFAALASSPN
jgi:hypothetical protein